MTAFFTSTFHTLVFIIGGMCWRVLDLDGTRGRDWCRDRAQGWPGICQWWEFPAVITVLGNTPNFAKEGNTGKYEILELFLLKYSFIFL